MGSDKARKENYKMNDRNKRLNQSEHDAILTQSLVLIPLEEEYHKTRTVSGLILPGGIKVMVMEDVSGLVFGLWRKQLNAKPFTVRGETIFKADLETYKELPTFGERS